MAKSPAHKLGQIIGDFIEEVFANELAKFARKHKLYLDKKGERSARPGKKVTWTDSFGNSHDLDFVLERNGKGNKIGEPVAFIECAWRRYTRHSRNKAQEIQGAILPLVATNKNYAPFIGVVLAGEFTGGALTQLKSLGFNVLYFPYDLIIKAFKKYNIDISTEESTSEKVLFNKIKNWKNFDKKKDIASYLLKLNKVNVDIFFNNLEKTVDRYIVSIGIRPLHGSYFSMLTIDEAITFINNYRTDKNDLPVLKYEILVRYNNEDKVEGVFSSKGTAIEFLKSYKGPKPKR